MAGWAKRCATLLAALLVAAPTVRGQALVVSTPFLGSDGDRLDRGFFVSSYGGTNILTVTLGYFADVVGSYQTSLTIRVGAYNGPIVGTSTLTTMLGPAMTVVDYDFGGAPVVPGSLLTFTQALITGPGAFVYYDVGEPGVPGVTQTNGTAPPLDVFRREQVGVVITQRLLPEPATLSLLGIGIAGVAFMRRRERRQDRAPSVKP